MPEKKNTLYYVFFYFWYYIVVLTEQLNWRSINWIENDDCVFVLVSLPNVHKLIFSETDSNLAAFADTGQWWCSTLLQWSRHCRTRECCHEVPCHWSTTDDRSACADMRQSRHSRRGLTCPTNHSQCGSRQTVANNVHMHQTYPQQTTPADLAIINIT